MNKFTKVGLLGAATISLLGVWALPAAATPTIGIDFPLGDTGAAPCSNDECVYGYEFAVGAPGITINALGAFDGSQSNPAKAGALTNFEVPDVIDLLTLSGTLLATETIGVNGVGATQVGNFWAFENLTTPLGLTAGDYLVMAQFNGSGGTGFYDQITNQPISGTIFGSGITYLQEEYCNNSAPNNKAGGNGDQYCSEATPGDFLSQGTTDNTMLVGANIEFTAGLPAPVPEPLTLAIFGAGLAGLALMRGRKKANMA